VTGSSSEQDLLNTVAEEFAERQRQGERPSLTEYIGRYPQLAEQIRELFPALALMEQVRPAQGEATAAGAAASAGDPARPECLGEFRILCEVGRGGMGIVYEAVQESLGRHVALKVLPGHALLKPTHLQRFEREAKAAAQLHHTNIVPVYGVGADQGLHYYVMQFIQGLGLDEVLTELRRLRRVQQAPAASATGRDRVTPSGRSRELSAEQVAQALLTGDCTLGHPSARGEQPPADPSPQPAAEAPRTSVPSSAVHLPGQADGSTLSESGRSYWHSVARVGIQVAQALAYAHGQGILHRDIKPSNLLLDTQGHVWVTDFGLAKTADSADLTHPGDIVGTVRYLAPERFEAKADARSDVYALGLTLYELLTLRSAFGETDRNKLVAEVLQAEPPRPRQLNPEVPRDLETVVLKALERDPERRYATAQALADDLQRVVEDRPIRARRVSGAERLGRWSRRNPLVAGLLATVAASLVAGTGLSAYFALEAREQAQHALGQKELADQQARAAEDRRQQAVTNLYHSHVREARALRLARVDGYRPEVWELLQQAMELDTPERNVDELRREAISCLGDFVGLQPTLWEDFETGISSLALLPDDQLALGLSDGTIVLRNLVTGAEITRLREHRSPVTSLYFALDGTRLVSNEERAGTFKIWELNANGQWHGARTITLDPLIVGYGPSAVFPFVVPYVLSPRVVARGCSADGRQFATAHGYGPPFVPQIVPQSRTISIWNLADGSLAARFSGLGEEILTNLAFSPDGNLLAAGYRTKAEYGILVWHVATRQVERRVPLDARVTSIGFTPNGKLLACDTYEGLLLFDTATFQPRPLPAGYAGRPLAFSPDSQLIAFYAYQRAVVHVWDLALDREVAQLRQPVRPVRMVFSRDGRRLVIAGERSVRIWSLPHTEEKLVLRGHARGVPGVAFSPDGRLLASASKDRTVKIWNSLTGQLDKELTGFAGVVQAVAFSADGRLLATGDWASGLQIWDVKTWNVLTVVQHNLGSQLWATPFAPNGNFFAAGGDGGVTIWRMETGGGDPGAPPRLLLQPIAHPSNRYTCSLCFSPDSKLVAWGLNSTLINRPDLNGAIHLWDLVHSQKLPAPVSRLENHARALSFSPDSRHLVFVNQQRAIEAWNVATGQPAASFGGGELRQWNTTTALSADGAWFAVADGRSALVWDMASRKQLLELPEERGTNGTIWSLAWSPDRTRLAVGSSDGGLVIWNIPKIREQLAALGLDW
jgi:WD40 repeat protein/serine/threonine protein kinase